ncbi:hypothetical protein RRG08_018894 [Elysia crispata]|uniref:Uncharacterized protein n=1 Tax=Elysia crispata TaxID=231223 RepID=A0AAE1DUD2_9GAST|nr:hypothetical protein RRG08_018894 [Elysia crispata]
MEEGKVSWLELSSNDSKETTWRRERSRGWSYLLMTDSKETTWRRERSRGWSYLLRTVRRQHRGEKGLVAGAIF